MCECLNCQEMIGRILVERDQAREEPKDASRDLIFINDRLEEVGEELKQTRGLLDEISRRRTIDIGDLCRLADDLEFANRELETLKAKKEVR